jgi:hypothetical protein
VKNPLLPKGCEGCEKNPCNLECIHLGERLKAQGLPEFANILPPEKKGEEVMAGDH